MSDYEPNFKAIETRYRGYRMRSRLEARWAAFFDAMKFEWIYEMEGFELPSGRYLPDFYLPRVKMYAEVKPEPFNDREFQLARELVIATNRPIIQLDGPPEPTNYWALVPFLDAGSREPMWTDLEWDEGHDYYATENRFFMSTCFGSSGYPVRLRIEGCCFEDAIEFSRAQRFGERGEK